MSIKDNGFIDSSSLGVVSRWWSIMAFSVTSYHFWIKPRRGEKEGAKRLRLINSLPSIRMIEFPRTSFKEPLNAPIKCLQQWPSRPRHIGDVVITRTFLDDVDQRPASGCHEIRIDNDIQISPAFDCKGLSGVRRLVQGRGIAHVLQCHFRCK